MPRKPKDLTRSVAQLRVAVRRRWQAVGVHCALTLLSGIALVTLSLFDVGGFWWFLCAMGVFSGLIGLFAEINAIYDTKKRIAKAQDEIDRLTQSDSGEAD
jgi:hypothetical protein